MLYRNELVPVDGWMMDCCQYPPSIPQESPSFVHPNGSFFDRQSCLDLMKSCAEEKNLQKARLLHSVILQEALVPGDSRLSNALLSMYAKCGAPSEAQKVFDDIPERDKSTVSWTALISGYVQHGLYHEALECFRMMQDAGFTADVVTFVCILKACGRTKALPMGEEIHMEVVKLGLLRKGVTLGTALMTMYAKCGALSEAQEVFESLPMRNVISWNSLISGYAEHGFGEDALRCLQKMQDEGLSPNIITFVCSLKACGIVGSIAIGEDIHMEVKKQGLLDKSVILGNALVDMYARCNMLEKARNVLEGLSVRNVVSWSILISGYAQHGLHTEAFDCFKQMQGEGLQPDAVSFVCLLKACNSIEFLEMGEKIHSEVSKRKLSENDVSLGTALVDMYVNCSRLQKAEEVFNDLPVRNVITWNVLITGYVRHEFYQEAVYSMQKMREEGLSPNAVTFTCILKSCGCLGYLEMGEEIHTEMTRQGLLESNIVLGTALVDMYGKCGAVAEAEDVFETLSGKNTVAWSAMIEAYTQQRNCDEAMRCFERMKKTGLSPDAVTFISLLKVCGSTGHLKMGESIHMEVTKLGLLENELDLVTALVNMYAKSGALGKALDVFQEFLVQNVATWNALMDGYADCGFVGEALHCLRRMQERSLFPNEVTFICALKACSYTGSLMIGQQIHAQVCNQGYLETNIALGATLVDMYAKCGVQAKAQDTFNELPVKSITSWSALLAGYAHQGEVATVFGTFCKTMMTGIYVPDVITFSILLNACSHAGLLVEGKAIIDGMKAIYNQTPTIEHYACIVDIYSRGGCFEKAVSIIEKIPSHDRLPLWLALLGSCQNWMSLEMGRFAFEQLLLLDEKCGAAYICMGNIYASASIYARSQES